MAAHSNSSPSPLSSRPTNPNPRNSENNSATRRSFSGNNLFAKPSVLTNSRRFDPITPANSPSDFARRRSVGKEGMGSHPRDCEEKENNEKESILKASKLQPPAKGSKNFMSPTISAASKFTPSPRKKVLVERNDPVRTSISLSDGKAIFFSNMSSNVSEDLESKSEMGHHQNQKNGSSLDLDAADSEKMKAVQEGPQASKPPKKVTFSDVPSDSQQATESLSESVITDTDSNSWKLESNLMSKVSCSSISPAIAPLDADPFLPPYDPKTNYLSPRPQFLHYKPNPRIEILLNKEKGLDPDKFKQLEDGFMAETMSENFSDSEGTEDSQTEDSQKEEVEANALADMVIGVEETENVPCVSEPSETLPVSTPVANAISEENLVQKNANKSWALSRLMCFSMLLMFLIACVSITVTHSPLSDELVLKDLSLTDLSKFYHQSRVAASAKVNFDQLARHVNQLSVNSIFFISKVANELGKGEKLGPLQFMNLSDLQKNTWNGEHIREDDGKEIVENLGEDELEEDMDTEMETLEKEAYAEVDSDDNFDKEFNARDDILEAEEVSFDSVKIVELKSEHSQDIQVRREFVSSANTPDWSEESSADQLAAIALDQEAEVEAASDTEEAEKSHADINLGPDCAAADTTSLDQKCRSDANSLIDEVVQSTPMLESPTSEDKILAHYVMGVSSFFAALAAVAVFIYHYKRNPSLAFVVQADPLLSKQQTGCAFTGKSTNHVYQEKQFSQNWQTEVDVVGESCPSEMSSFQKSASYSSKKELREVQSSEGKTRKYYSKRASLASSSEYSAGSPSFGSFTTYERIPNKNANGDEEIITPVRRSSRIRNHHHHQFTSP